jgi:Fur family transcriptional regulator, ferric uptake regulator
MSLDEDHLRRLGVRLTPQRRMILDAIACCAGHVTAEQIYERIALTYTHMSLSTVYRNLERLIDLRLIAATDLGGGRICYSAIDVARHHHLICHQCGAMLDIGDDLLDGLRSAILATYGFATSIDHLALWGTCSRCLSAEPPPVL